MKITVRYRQLIIAAFVVITCMLLGSLAASSAQSLGSSNPYIEVVKTADPTMIYPGDTVVYTYGITNTDDVTLTNVILSDDKLGPINLLPSRVISGLQALYTFEEGIGTMVLDVSGVEPLLHLTVRDEAAVDWIPGGGLSITSSTIISSAVTATKIIDACRGSGEISIEAWIRPANTTQGPESPARIVTLSGSAGARDFTLGQQAAAYDVRLRTTATDENGIPSLTAGTVTTELSHVVYTRDRFGVARLYVNTVEVGSRYIGGDFSNWNEGFYFGLANEFGGDERLWLGEYHLVAIYNRALSQDEVIRNFEAKAGIVLFPGESIIATASTALDTDTTNTATVTGTMSAGVTVTDTDTATVYVIWHPPYFFEPNDTMHQARGIPIGTPQRHYFEEKGDVDWMKFRAWAGIEYTIRTYDLDDTNATKLWLYDEDGVWPLRVSPGNPAATIDSWEAPADGTYFIRVAHPKYQGGQGGDGFAYSLHVSEWDPCSDGYEPDNTRDDAKPITIDGVPQPHTFHGPCGGDVDWVKFDAVTGKMYTIQTSGLGGGNDTVLCLYDASDPNGDEIACNDDNVGYPPASRIDWVATAPGTYYVKVAPFNLFTDGCDLSYDLKVVEAETAPPPTPTPPPGVCADDFEPDDVRGRAEPIVVNDEPQYRSFHAAGDEDWVKFWAFAGNQYTIKTLDLSPGNDTVLCLYTPEEICHDDNNSPYDLASTIVWSPTASGTYYAKVSPADSVPGCRTYRLVITSIVPYKDEYEEDDTREQAQPIEVDGPRQSHNFHVPCVCGSERAADEADWVWFEAIEGFVYTIKTSDLEGGNDTVLELYDEDHVPPVEVMNDDYADDIPASRIVWEAPENGKYYVKVSPFDHRAGGYGVNYDLEVTTGITLDLTASPDEIMADGHSISTITAEVSVGGVRALSSVTVTFAATPGVTLSAPSNVTGPDGKASVVLTSGEIEGTATVTAHLDVSSVADAVEVRLTRPQYTIYLPLILKPCACKEDNPDGDNSPEQARPLEPGEPVEGYICCEHIHLEDGKLVERDYYKFEIDTLYDIDVYLDVPDTVNYDLFLWVGRWPWEGSENPERGAGEHIHWTAQGIGTYYVVVKSLGDCDNCEPYKLTVTLKSQ